MVLGIISVVGSFALFPLLLAPLAWYFGAVAVREAEREPQRWSRSGSARAGWVLGMIGSAILAAALLLLALVVGGIVILFRQGGDYGAHLDTVLTLLA